jgi:hypothetical protein
MARLNLKSMTIGLRIICIGILQVPTSMYRLVVLIKSLRRFKKKTSHKIRIWNLGATFFIVWHHIVTRFSSCREKVGSFYRYCLRRSPTTDMASVGDNNLFERMRFPSRGDSPGVRAGTILPKPCPSGLLLSHISRNSLSLWRQY